MDAILEAKAKVLNVFDQIEDIIKTEATKHAAFISELNREQLQQGKKADGSNMPNYVDDSRQPSAPGKITLFEHGDFYEGIEPLFQEEGLDMVGLDDKTALMVWGYGEEILGLTEKNQLKLAKKLLPGVVRELKKRLKRK